MECATPVLLAELTTLSLALWPALLASRTRSLIPRIEGKKEGGSLHGGQGIIGEHVKYKGDITIHDMIIVPALPASRAERLALLHIGFGQARFEAGDEIGFPAFFWKAVVVAGGTQFGHDKLWGVVGQT